MSRVPTCPGQYCGRTQLENGTWSECGACPRGFRANFTGHCILCQGELLLYDWLYLGFMALLALVLHWFFIDIVYKRESFNRQLVSMHLCAALEVGAACALTLLLAEPMGSLNVHACRAAQLSDWYTLLRNPSPHYGPTLHCTQEAVYPLYTLVLIMYTLCIALLLLYRCVLFPSLLPACSALAVYCGLYFLPILMLIHAVGAGLIYYSFPYIIIILSMMSSASHFSLKPNQSVSELLRSSVTEVRNVVILGGHWLLHAYGIVSITGFRDPAFHGALFALVPAPAAFYILTSRFTDPMKIRVE